MYPCRWSFQLSVNAHCVGLRMCEASPGYRHICSPSSTSHSLFCGLATDITSAAGVLGDIQGLVRDIGACTRNNTRIGRMLGRGRRLIIGTRRERVLLGDATRGHCRGQVTVLSLLRGSYRLDLQVFFKVGDGPLMHVICSTKAGSLLGVDAPACELTGLCGCVGVGTVDGHIVERLTLFAAYDG
jgi:hypothetical protein